MSVKSSLVIVLFAILTLPFQAGATRFGPDTYPYIMRDDTYTFSFEDISSTGTRILNNDDNSAVNINIGFGFLFYGTEYDQLWVSTNGIIGFPNSFTSAANVSFTATTPSPDQDLIAVLWDDWHTIPDNDGLGCCSDADAVYYEVKGTSPNRYLVIQWNKLYGVTSSPSSVTFEVLLFEATNKIVMQYQDTTSGDSRDDGGSATVGTRKSSSRFDCNTTLGCFENFSLPLNQGFNCGQRLQRSFNSAVITASTALEWVPADVGLGAGTCNAAHFTNIAAAESSCGDIDTQTSTQSPTGIDFNSVLSLVTGVVFNVGAEIDAKTVDTQVAVECVPSVIATFTDSNSYVSRLNMESLVPIPYQWNCDGFEAEDIAVDSTNGDFWVFMYTQKSPFVESTAISS